MPDPWRMIVKTDAEVADLLAVPSAVAEGKIAGRYIGGASSPDTIIVQRVRRKGILAGAEVPLDHDGAAEAGIDLAVTPRAGRAAARPAGTIGLQEMKTRSSDKRETAVAGESDLAALIYTSGTTGMPKGVMLTHGNFAAQCAVADTMIVTDFSDVFASLVPFFHVFGLADGCVLALHRGSPSVLIPQYAPRRFLATLKEHKVTVILGIPSQYLHLLIAARRRFRSEEDRPHVKYCICGAAPLSTKVIEAFGEVFGATIVEGYGMTETTSAVAVNPPERIKPGSIGVPMGGVAMKVVDDDGADVAQGQAGEIVIKGAVTTPGYYNHPEESRAAFVDGWLRTGDIGYIDEDGYFYITDRKKDLIIKGGFNISPKEIEDVLDQHARVKESAVIGYHVSDGKEGIRAFCVASEEGAVGEDELVKWCRETLAAYKVPDSIVFRTALPRTATGKLLKRELREGYHDPRLIEKEDAA